MKHNILNACKVAYIKLHLGDESITDKEVSEILMNALCNEIGDDKFCRFVEVNAKRIQKNIGFTERGGR